MKSFSELDLKIKEMAKRIKELREIEGLAKKGFKEVVLTGIHLSSFGRDLNEEKLPMLKELIVEAGKIPGIKRIRLGSLEPNIITEDFLKAVSSCEAFCPHFHLSMQSGSDATLKRMNRHYTAEEYFEKCELIRKYFEHAAITTDVIAGFPGETEEEFEETLAFVKRVGFAEMHVFKYSRRKGTKADTMKNQVPDAVKTERSKKLMEIAEASQREYLSWYVGKEVEILTEDQVSVDGKAKRDGHTKTYVKCICDCDRANELVKRKVVAVSEEKTLITV